MPAPEPEDDLDVVSSEGDGVPAAGGRPGPAKRRGAAVPAEGRRKRKPLDYGRDRAETGKGEQDSPPAPLPKPGPAEDEAAYSADRPWWQRWPAIAAAAAVVVLAGFGGAYFLFGTAKEPPKKKEVAKSSPTPKPAPATTAKAPVDTKPSAPSAPSAKPSAVEAQKISAARLAAELAAAPAEAGAKYEGAALEVSGLLDKIDQEMQKPGAGPPTFHPVFAAEGALLRCDLEGSPTPLPRWRALAVGQPFTVRGVYNGKEGSLRDCELLPPAAPADARWKGKEVEVVGSVDRVFLSEDGQAYPTVQLEGDTWAKGFVHCLFRKSDEEEVKKIAPGTLLTVHGTCGGREHRSEEGNYRVRLDNCQVVYTSAPTPPTQRLEAGALMRDYEEDLRRDLLPAPGTEERVEQAFSVSQLAREVAGDGEALGKKYRYKVLTVSGRVLRKVPPQGVILESDNTDQLLNVSCGFTKHAFKDLEEGPQLCVRGLCTGMQGPRTLRLDDCESFDPTGKADRRRLTADYLPHKPGRTLTYDVAKLRSTAGAESVVVRQVFFERDNGLTETMVTHSGSLVGASLFDKGDTGKWASQSKTRKVRLPGPVYQHRLSGGFVEVGQQILTSGRQIETVWEPALKVGARVGESWKWFNLNTEHDYTLEKFDEHQGRPCAVIKEVVITSADERRPTEVRHVYVRELGEVERQEVLRLANQEKKVLAEKRLVEDLAAGATKGAPGDKAPAPTGEAERPKDTRETPANPKDVKEAPARPPS
jgi:hypothetical protein